jgi:septal ring factor EnvC (AmiA/AmiB activator)
VVFLEDRKNAAERDRLRSEIEKLNDDLELSAVEHQAQTRHLQNRLKTLQERGIETCMLKFSFPAACPNKFLLGRRASIAKRLNEAQRRLTWLNSEIPAVRKLLSTIGSEREVGLSKIAALEVEVDRLTASIASLQGDLAEVEAAIIAL